MSHHADEQSPPPSPLAASQRPCRPKLSRARRKLIGASHRFGLLHYLQIFIHYLQCIGEQYSTDGQRQVIYFHTASSQGGNRSGLGLWKRAKVISDAG